MATEYPVRVRQWAVEKVLQQEAESGRAGNKGPAEIIADAAVLEQYVLKGKDS